MSAPDTLAAIEALWDCMVALAEQSHDAVVDAQAHPTAEHANHIARLADELGALARAASLLARRGSDAAT